MRAPVRVLNALISIRTPDGRDLDVYDASPSDGNRVLIRELLAG